MKLIRLCWHYLIGRSSADLGSIEWSWQRQQRAEDMTARILLGAHGKVRIVGDRCVEARERIVEARRLGEQ